MHNLTVTLIVALCCLCTPVFGADQHLVRVYMSPTGSDMQPGSSEANAVKLLQTAVDLGIRSSTKETNRIEIRVAEGIYPGQQVKTTAHPSGIPIFILPVNDTRERPVFDGAGGGGTWFILDNRTGMPTRVTIAGMRIINYVTAVSFNGDRNNHSASNGQNVLRNNVFENIGSIAMPSGGLSTAAVRLVNSDANTILRNRFVSIRNVRRCAALHAIYLAHGSTANIIEENIFEDGCGPTIKVRDGSDANVIRRNRFIQQDTNATFVDSYCNKEENPDCTKAEAECPSWSNVYDDNQVEMKRSAANLLPVRIRKGSSPSACKLPGPNDVRVREVNTRIVK